MTMSEETIGLDTSVVMRILTGEPESQARAAREFVRRAMLRGGRLVVSDLVVAEAYFALVSHYAVSKSEAVQGLLEMFERGAVEPADDACVLEVLHAMESGAQKPGLVDRLIHAQYARLAAPMATFERASRKLAGTQVLAE